MKEGKGDREGKAGGGEGEGRIREGGKQGEGSPCVSLNFP